MTAPDPTTRARELTAQALDADQGVTIRHITVAAAQVEATLALAEAVRGLAPRVDRPRWDDDLRVPARYTCRICPRTDPHSHRAGTPLDEWGDNRALTPVPDVTFDHPITVAGTPAEQRHREDQP